MPADTVAHDVLVPSVVRYLPELLVWLGASALNAEFAVVCPVPPFAIASVPASVMVPEVVMGLPETVRPVVPPESATEVTVPPEPVADSVPPAKLIPEPIDTLLKPPEPFPYRIDVPLVAGA